MYTKIQYIFSKLYFSFGQKFILNDTIVFKLTYLSIMLYKKPKKATDPDYNKSK